MKNVPKTQSQLAKVVLVASLLALGCTGIGSKARAADQPTAATEHAITQSWVSYPVGFSDLNITTMAGAKILYLRIRYAAETLCQSAATWGKKEGETCVRKSIDDAVLRVNSPLLTQYYQLRRKGDKGGLVQFAKAN